MTKKEYIKLHGKSMLANALECTDWTENTPVQIIGGLDAPYNPCSNLYHALQRSKLGLYVIGGHRQMGTEGWWIAVA